MKKRNRGFTLLELMVVIVLAAILFGLGIPNFRNAIRNSRMTSLANDLVAALHTARSEAVKRRAVAVVCSSAAPLDAAPACGAGTGWVVWADEDADLVIDADEPLLIQHEPMPATISAAPRDAAAASIANGWYVAFADNGLPLPLPTAGALSALRSVVLCDERGNVTSLGDVSAARLVTVSPIGRPAVSRVVAEIAVPGGCANGG